MFSALTTLGLTILIGYYSGHLARRVNLPALIGYMLLGILLGPSLSGIISQELLDSFSFISRVGLGFVAFSIGSELNLGALKKIGSGIIAIILGSSLLAFLSVSAAIYLLSRNLPMAILFGAMAPATAPAGTVAVIQELRAHGNLTKAIYAVVGFDDGLAIIIFGLALAWARSIMLGNSGDILPALGHSLIEITLSVLVGALIGYLLIFIVRHLKHPGDILILLIGTILLATGLAGQLELSFILVNMLVGFMLANQETVARQIRTPLGQILPLIYILFFTLAGAHLRLNSLPALGSLGLTYILARSFGKIAGAYLGGFAGSIDKTIRRLIGPGILAQAGVAIGFALIVNTQFSQLGLPEAAKIGQVLLATITASSIFFEIIGPLLTRHVLRRAGEVPGETP